MKFDSYPRFLRSDIYQNCLENGCDNEDSTPDDEDLILTTSSSIKLKKTRSNAEDRSRKSILPWNRKNRYNSIRFFFNLFKLKNNKIFIILSFQIQIQR